MMIMIMMMVRMRRYQVINLDKVRRFTSWGKETSPYSWLITSQFMDPRKFNLPGSGRPMTTRGSNDKSENPTAPPHQLSVCLLSKDLIQCTSQASASLNDEQKHQTTLFTHTERGSEMYKNDACYIKIIYIAHGGFWNWNFASVSWEIGTADGWMIYERGNVPFSERTQRYITGERERERSDKDAERKKERGWSAGDFTVQ